MNNDEHLNRNRRGTLDKFLFNCKFTAKISLILSIDPNQNNAMPMRANTSVITNNELKKIREQISGNTQNKSSVSVVDRSELARIKREMVVKSTTDLAAERTM